MPLPNRLAVYAAAIAALAAALVPVIANLDTSSTVGLVGGVGAFAGVIAVWLRGWAAYEERTDLLELDPSDPNAQTPLGDDPRAEV